MWRKKIELKSPKLHTQGPLAHEATRLGLGCKGTPPQCNGGLFNRRLADPQGPKDGRQLACHPLTSGGLALEGVTCRECGDALKVSFFLALRERNRPEHQHMPAPNITKTHRQAQEHKHITKLKATQYY